MKLLRDLGAERFFAFLIFVIGLSALLVSSSLEDLAARLLVDVLAGGWVLAGAASLISQRRAPSGGEPVTIGNEQIGTLLPDGSILFAKGFSSNRQSRASLCRPNANGAAPINGARDGRR